MTPTAAPTKTSTARPAAAPRSLLGPGAMEYYLPGAVRLGVAFVEADLALQAALAHHTDAELDDIAQYGPVPASGMATDWDVARAAGALLKARARGADAGARQGQMVAA